MTGQTLDFINKAKAEANNQRWPTILMGDLNVKLDAIIDINDSGAGRQAETESLMASMSLTSMRKLFRQKKK
jgi:hypothetical protein